MKKLIVTIEARMNSSRLPGKVMMEISKKPLLIHLIENLKSLDEIDDIVVATTTNLKDDIICKYLDKMNVSYFRGDEMDVLGRVTKASIKFEADVVIQLTADNPLIDPKIIEKGIRIFLESDFDCVSNTFTKSYPSGMDVTIFRRDFLEFISKKACNEKYREHVPLYVKENKNKFKIFEFFAEDKINRPDISLTVDEESEFKMVKKIIEHFKLNSISCEDLIDFVEKR